jgi:hypothetical protein
MAWLFNKCLDLHYAFVKWRTARQMRSLIDKELAESARLRREHRIK